MLTGRPGLNLKSQRGQPEKASDLQSTIFSPLSGVSELNSVISYFFVLQGGVGPPLGEAFVPPSKDLGALKSRTDFLVSLLNTLDDDSFSQIVMFSPNRSKDCSFHRLDTTRHLFIINQ